MNKNDNLRFLFTAKDDIMPKNKYFKAKNIASKIVPETMKNLNPLISTHAIHQIVPKYEEKPHEYIFNLLGFSL